MLLGSGPTLEATEASQQDLSRILVKMQGRHQKENVNDILNKIFEIAGSKMKDEHDKSVLQGLQKYVALV